MEKPGQRAMRGALLLKCLAGLGKHLAQTLPLALNIGTPLPL
jgi:PII-like signaling protein